MTRLKATISSSLAFPFPRAFPSLIAPPAAGVEASYLFPVIADEHKVRVVVVSDNRSSVNVIKQDRFRAVVLEYDDQLPGSRGERPGQWRRHRFSLVSHVQCPTLSTCLASPYSPVTTTGHRWVRQASGRYGAPTQNRRGRLDEHLGLAHRTAYGKHRFAMAHENLPC